MLDVQSGGLEKKLQLKECNLNPLQVYGFHQLISQPTHLLPQNSSCIDLIFTDQPDLIVDSGVHPSLHLNCHHQITYCKLNLNTEYLPPYEHFVWDCKRANVEGSRKSLSLLIGE